MKSNSFLSQLKIEFNIMLSNRSVFLIMAVAPLFYGLFYSYPYINELPKKIPIAVVDLDKSKYSRQFSDLINNSENTEIYELTSTFNEAKELFYKRKIYSIVIIPQEFSKDIILGKTANIAAYTDGSYLLYYKQALSGLQKAASAFGSSIVISKLQNAGIPHKEAEKWRTAVALNNYPLFNPASGYATYVLPAVFVLICHQIMIITISMSMALAKQSNYYKNQTINMPISSIFIAKITACFIIMSLQALFLFAVVLPMYKIPFMGSYIQIILFLFPFFMTVIPIGIILGTIFKKPETIIIYIAVTSLPLLFLSGVPWAETSMPEAIKILHNILPSSYGITGFVQIYREGASLGEIYSSVAVLWSMSLALLSIAFIRLKKYISE